ncbi:MAG: S4 domain-containing protein [Actinomycetota bacterium]
MTGDVASARVDQWLWSVRIARTRTDAAAACKGGRVEVNDRRAKPATPVKIGDVVVARMHGCERVVVVEKVISKRVGAAIAVDCFEDRSPPPPERDPIDAAFAVRDPGAGRPTKRDRRQIDRLRGRR